jgi:hypothetical protein
MRWSALLALSLLMWAAAVESTHNHPNQTDSASCSICMAAHTASPAVSCEQRSPLFTAIGLLQADDVAIPAQFNFSDQGIRGPPAAL